MGSDEGVSYRYKVSYYISETNWLGESKRAYTVSYWSTEEQAQAVADNVRRSACVSGVEVRDVEAPVTMEEYGKDTARA